MVRRSPSRSRSSRKKKGSSAGRFFLFVFLLALLAVGAAASLLYLPAGPTKEVFVEIAPGSSSQQIAAQLEHAGVVRSRYAFDFIRLWKRGSLKAGEYRFDHAAPVGDVYTRIVRGDVYTLPLTVPEGATRFDIASKIAQAGFLNVTREQFLAATIAETHLIAELDPRARNLEGYLFPDTYRFQRRVTAEQIVAAMVRRFKSATGPLQLAQTPSQMGVTPASARRDLHDVVTLASLVERETALNVERPLVASVLSNRLAKEMPLMTDPSVIYGLEVEGRWRGAIYQSDLSDPKKDTAYNTYRHTGLPPGPISNPGLPSLRAALHPDSTDYLYFVAAGADPQGRSRFAATLDEHNKNVAAYRKAVKQAGGI